MAEYPNNNPQSNPNYGSWRIDESGNRVFPYQNSYQPPQPPKKPKRTSGKHASTALLVALCMVLSAACGFGGAAAANLLTAKEESAPVVSFEEQSSTSENNSSSAPASSESSSKITQTTYDSDSMPTTEVVKKAADSVVEIVTETVSRDSMFGQYVTSGAGSGVILTTNGYIVTNHHVIEGATNITITLRNGTSHNAALIASDAPSDLAVIKIEAENLTAAVLANSDTLEVGQTAIAIGNPLGSLGGSVTQGILSALDREITIEDNVMTLLQTDAAINPGNSGGGLFNDKGELIGVVNAKQSGESIDGLGFAIPANLVKTVVEQLIDQGYVSGRISTGMSLIDIDDLYTAYYYGVSRTGVYVQSVTGSNAENAGLRAGDCIVAVGETKVSTVSEFNAAIKQYAVGDSVELLVIRSNRQGTLTLVLDEYTGEATNPFR